MRCDGRSFDELRPLTVAYDSYGYADASVLFEQGKTKVLCTVNLQTGVPSFLKGTKTGWLKAEYAMLPAATHVRTQREACATTRSGRSVEISRLIGRSLRSMIDCGVLGERTVMIDCDVLQADGGTRTACITAAALALAKANERWLSKGVITQSCITKRVVGISVGVVQGQALVDLTFKEDSSIDADFNLVLNESGALIEVQGTAEREAVAWQTFEAVWRVARVTADILFRLFDETTTYAPASAENQEHQKNDSVQHQPIRQERVPLFSLRNRSTT